MKRNGISDWSIRLKAEVNRGFYPMKSNDIYACGDIADSSSKQSFFKNSEKVDIVFP